MSKSSVGIKGLLAVARCVRRGANGYDGSVGHHRTGERPVEEGGQVFAPANRWVTEDDAEEEEEKVLHNGSILSGCVCIARFSTLFSGFLEGFPLAALGLSFDFGCLVLPCHFVIPYFIIFVYVIQPLRRQAVARAVEGKQRLQNISTHYISKIVSSRASSYLLQVHFPKRRRLAFAYGSPQRRRSRQPPLPHHVHRLGAVASGG